MPDDSNVVALPGTRLNDGSASAAVIGFLETVLADARAGRIASIGCAWVTPHGAIECGIAWSGLPTVHQQVAASLYLLRRCEKANE